MAFAYLNQQGRIWQANGLNYLLFTQDLPVMESLCALKRPDRNSLRGKVCGEKFNSSKQSLSGEDNLQIKQASSARFLSQTAKVDVGERNTSKDAIVDLPEHATGKGRSASKTAGRKVSSPETWPLLWQKQLGRTKKARFAWTYMDLGADLINGNTEQKVVPSASEQSARQLRSQCMRKLFADLSHPIGTHTFWPIALPENDGQTYLTNIDCFWSGLELLNCRGVIFMGKKAATAAMGTEDIKPLTQLFKFGKLVWILWEPDEIAKNLKVYNAVLPFLKRSLGQFIKF